MDSCFVLIGTRQHGVAVLYETSDRASSNKMQRVPIRTKQLSTVAALFCRFLSGCCLAKSTLSRSISLAVCVTVYFWLIRSLVDPTSTYSIIVRGPLQFSRLKQSREQYQKGSKQSDIFRKYRYFSRKLHHG